MCLTLFYWVYPLGIKHLWMIFPFKRPFSAGIFSAGISQFATFTEGYHGFPHHTSIISSAVFPGRPRLPLHRRRRHSNFHRRRCSNRGSNRRARGQGHGRGRGLGAGQTGRGSLRGFLGMILLVLNAGNEGMIHWLTINNIQ